MTSPVAADSLDIAAVATDVAALLAAPPTAAVSTTGLNAFLAATENKWTATAYPPDQLKPFQAWFRLDSIEYTEVMSVSFGESRVLIRAAVVLQFERRDPSGTWAQMARFLSTDAVQKLLTTQLATSGAECVCNSADIATPEQAPDGFYSRVEFALEIRT